MKKYFGKDRIWATGITIFVTAFVAVNMAFVTLAFQNKPQLVSRDYYQQGYNLRELAEREAQSDAAGWSVGVKALPRAYADQPLVELTVSAAGQPADSLLGSVGFYRPLDQQLDMAALPVTRIGQGRYLVVLPRPLEHGAWQAEVQLAGGARTLARKVKFFVEG